MGSVFAKAHIGHDKYLGEGLLDCLDCEDYGAICGRSLRADRVFSGGSKWNAEEDYGAKAKCNEGLEEGDELVNAATALARKGGNKGFFVRVISNEKGIDEGGL
jgi:hypothetical protein